MARKTTSDDDEARLERLRAHGRREAERYAQPADPRNALSAYDHELVKPHGSLQNNADRVLMDKPIKKSGK